MEQRKVLITGFVPFGDHEYNISEDTVNNLPESIDLADPWEDGRKESTKISVEIVKKILTVDEDGSKFVSNLLDNGNRFDAIIHVGLAENSDKVRIESTGRDILDFRIPDNSGRQILSQKISGNGDLKTSCELKRWRVSTWDIPTRISDDAGEFLCNEVYHRTLNSIQRNNMKNENSRQIPCLFVHLPPPEVVKLEDCVKSIIEVTSHMLYVPVIDVVAGILVKEGKFLAARRSKEEAFAGFWEFPGGKLEINEDMHEAVVREFSEELEISVYSRGYIGTWWNDFGHLQVRLLVVWVSQICQNRVELSVHDDLVWCDPNKLPELDWLGPDEEIAHHVSDILRSTNLESK